MKRALLLLAAFALIGAAPANPPVGRKPAPAAEIARQQAMDRDESRAQARTAADEIVRLRQQLIALGAAETAGEKDVGDRARA